MFRQNELREINRIYFEVEEISILNIVLKSKTSGHIWNIQSRELFPGKRSIAIRHKHKRSDPYHEQALMHPKTITEAQELIMKHDAWHLNGRR